MNVMQGYKFLISAQWPVSTLYLMEVIVGRETDIRIAHIRNVYNSFSFVDLYLLKKITQYGKTLKYVDRKYPLML